GRQFLYQQGCVSFLQSQDTRAIAICAAQSKRSQHSSRDRDAMRLIANTLIAVAGLLLAANASFAAEDFPSRPIRVLVPYAAGGPSDTGARLASEPLSRQLGQPVIIENQGGGGGLNATESYKRYAPDGYTILLGAIGPLTIIPAAKKVTYDPMKDFVPLG